MALPLIRVRVVAEAAGWSTPIPGSDERPRRNTIRERARFRARGGKVRYQHHVARRGDVVDVPLADAARMVAIGVAERVDVDVPVDGVPDPGAAVADARRGRAARPPASEPQEAAAAAGKPAPKRKPTQRRKPPA